MGGNKIPQYNIKGISGSSAGAITALFVAMGIGYSQTKKLLKETVLINDMNGSRFVGIFETFFDYPPLKNKIDIINDAKKFRAIKINSEDIFENNKLIYSGTTYETPPMHIPFLKGFGKERAFEIAAWLVEFIDPNHNILSKRLLNYFGDPEKELLNKNLMKEIQDLNDLATQYFLKNLFFNNGLFVGDPVRHYFADKIDELLIKPARAKNPSLKVGNGYDLTFKEFYELTGVDLVITGTNVTDGLPFMFRKDFNAQMPVCEAVGISMNLPLIFKPVLFVPTGSEETMFDELPQFVDGGVMNNIPMHAFDYPLDSGITVSEYYKSYQDRIVPLNPYMLALRLGNTQITKRTTVGGKRTLEIFLFNYISSLLGTLMYPSELGQIRTPDEYSQTIALSTKGLDLLNFNPSDMQLFGDYKTYAAVPMAFEKVMNYFGLFMQWDRNWEKE
ncbi:MAG TPA: patatin-like phospholipase family protein [Chitinophagales bacterium]|nr:patatin-like phospholipase family protein [Chitinophagales bacterium]